MIGLGASRLYKNHPVPIVLHLVQPLGACGHLVRLGGKRKRVQHSVGKEFRQSIDVLDLTGIAHGEHRGIFAMRGYY